MGSTEGSTNNGAPAIRIDGWKDIAAHLGRSVRTVQRWERELGLPIRRLDTGTAEVVNALRDELDAWVVRHSRVSQAEPADERTPATLQGRTLTAKSADGTVLWTKQFDTTFMDFFETAAGSLTVSRMRIPIRCASATWHTTLSE